VGFEKQDRRRETDFMGSSQSFSRRKEDVGVIESREPEPVEMEVFICLKSPRART
jgi:hypothetical protein